MRAVPRVSVRSWLRRPMRPREGILNSRRTRQEPCLEKMGEVAGSEIAAFATGERATVDRENHGQRGLINDERFERRGIIQIRKAFTDLNAFDAGDGDDVTRDDLFGFVALEAA